MLEKIGLMKPAKKPDERTDYGMECKDGVCKLVKKTPGQSDDSNVVGQSENEKLSSGETVPENYGDSKEATAPEAKKVQ